MSPGEALDPTHCPSSGCRGGNAPPSPRKYSVRLFVPYFLFVYRRVLTLNMLLECCGPHYCTHVLQHCCPFCQAPVVGLEPIPQLLPELWWAEACFPREEVWANCAAKISVFALAVQHVQAPHGNMSVSSVQETCA